MVLDLDEKYIPSPIKPITAKDRQKYLITDEEVAKYSDAIYQMPDVTEMLKKQQEKEEHRELYDKVAKISHLKIAEVEKLLFDVAAKNDYSKF